MPETVGGIPLHPLLVHAAVVLVPLAAFCVVAAALSRRFRGWAGLLTPLLATAALVTVPLATGSGESLEESVTETPLMEVHTEMGEQLLPWVIGLAVTGWGLWLLARRRGTPTGGVLPRILVALSLVAALGSAVQVVRIGHSGAESVWSQTGP